MDSLWFGIKKSLEFIFKVFLQSCTEVLLSVFANWRYCRLWSSINLKFNCELVVRNMYILPLLEPTNFIVLLNGWDFLLSRAKWASYFQIKSGHEKSHEFLQGCRNNFPWYCHYPSIKCFLYIYLSCRGEFKFLCDS